MMWKVYQFWLIVLFSILSWGMFVLVIYNISPIESPNIAFPLLYISFFFSVLFTVAAMASLVWKALIPVKSSYLCLSNGIREGIMAGIGADILLFFLQSHSFGWIQPIIILIIIAITEYFFAK